MSFVESSILIKITFGLLIFCLILQILGLALPYWYKIKRGEIEYHGGLFRNCVKIPGTTRCSDNVDENLESWFEATMAFEILGMMFIVAAIIVTSLSLFVMSEMKLLKLIGWTLSFTACAFILIGVCIYGGEASGVLTEYSGAFAVTIIAGIVSLAAGILGLLDWVGFKL